MNEVSNNLLKYFFFFSVCLSFITSSVGIRCVLNPFYVPVCGSDNRTYGNRDLLNCFNQKRPAVRRKWRQF